MEQFKRQWRKLCKALGRFWQRVRAGSVLDIAILACAGLLVLVLAAILVVSLTAGGRAAPSGGMDIVNSAPSAVSVVEPDYDKAEGELDQTAYSGTILPQTDDAGESYIDETLFVGDSNSARMVAFGKTTWQNNLGIVSMGVQHVTGSACVQLKGYGYVYVPKAISLMQPKRIIITFGTNNAYESTDTFINWYGKALDAIEEAWPYADIIIGSVPPVAKTRSYPDITMKTIDSFNKALVNLAGERGYKFLNASEELKGSDGYAKSGYMEKDGIHFTQKGMDAWLKYMRTHAYETEDRRPKPLSAVPTHYETPETFFNPPKPVSSSSSSENEENECDHDWVETARLEPTCTEQGAVAYKCSKCGEETSEILPAKGHVWGPTDQTTGMRVCTVCGLSEKDPTWTGAHVHTWGATDPSTGLRVCATCGATEQDPSWVAPHVHSWGATDPGTGLRVCATCGATEQDPSWVAPHVHSWGATDPGTGLRVCTTCGATEQDPSWAAPPPVTTPPPEQGTVDIPSASIPAA